MTDTQIGFRLTAATGLDRIDRTMRTALNFTYQSHVLRMRADPKPNDDVPVFRAQRSPSEGDANGVNLVVTLRRLEAERGVVGVALEVPVCTDRLPLNLTQQAAKALIEFRGPMRNQSASGSSGFVSPARYSAMASSASAARLSPLLSSAASQPNSPSRSASKCAAAASCRSGGSCCICWIAFSSSRVIARARCRVFDSVFAPMVTLYTENESSVSSSLAMLARGLRREFGFGHRTRSRSSWLHVCADEFSAGQPLAAPFPKTRDSHLARGSVQPPPRRTR